MSDLRMKYGVLQTAVSECQPINLSAIIYLNNIFAKEFFCMMGNFHSAYISMEIKLFGVEVSYELHSLGYLLKRWQLPSLSENYPGLWNHDIHYRFR